MVDPASDAEIRIPSPTLQGLVTAPFRAQTYLKLVYLGLSFPLGIAYFVFLSVGLSLGAAFSLLLFGIPLLLAVLLVAHGLAEFERLQTRYLLDGDLTAPSFSFLEDVGLLERTKRLVLDGMTYRSVIFLASKLAVGVAAFTMLVTGVVTSAVFVATPLFYDRPGVNVGVFPTEPVQITSQIYVPWDDLLVGFESAVAISWRVNTLPEALLFSVFGLVLLVLSLNIFNAFAWLVGEYTRLMLGDVRLRDVTVRRV